MRRVLLSVVVSAFAGVAASIASCGAAFADGAQGQNAPAETKAYVRKVVGGNTSTDNRVSPQDMAAVLGLASQKKPTSPQQNSPDNRVSAKDMAALLGLSSQKSPTTGAQEPSSVPGTLSENGHKLIPVDYDPFAWYQQPVSGGLQEIAAWLLLGVSVLMLFMMTRMRWFNQRYVGWNRLFVALSGLWLSAVGGVLILIGGVPIEEWAGIVYVPVIGFLVLYKLTAWVISGFAK